VAAGRRREALRQVEARAPGAVRLERRAFLLLPGEGERPVYDDYVISHRVEARRRAPELPFSVPRRGQPYPRSSLPAQLVALAARERDPDRVEALEDAVFRAVFVDLADTAEPDVLRRCAASAGLDPAVVDRALADPALRARVVREHQEADELGISGIPALVLPGEAPIVGGVTTSVYIAALERAVRDAPTEARRPAR
jgi:predicted DsbA family dithiol-disulfide isomerase